MNISFDRANSWVVQSPDCRFYPLDSRICNCAVELWRTDLRFWMCPCAVEFWIPDSRGQIWTWHCPILDSFWIAQSRFWILAWQRSLHCPTNSDRIPIRIRAVRSDSLGIRSDSAQTGFWVDTCHFQLPGPIRIQSDSEWVQSDCLDSDRIMPHWTLLGFRRIPRSPSDLH